MDFRRHLVYVRRFDSRSTLPARSICFSKNAQRDGETEDGAKRMIAAQASRAERLSIADDIVEVNGWLEQAEGQ